jgi:RHH-type proline utilization regulon transcriptional repressor/proline dehydrogenase/delta 1-pyrroline-5-carboxylate dehydrogenase
MGAALADAGKTLMESDPEVSEAVDFVEFYSATARHFEELSGIDTSPLGVVVVVSPWNFPIAIPCGGIAAALAAGNTTILKPASNAVLVAHVLCECFYRAGIPRSALQLLPCSGGTVGQKLVSHPDVDTVILTGGTETAQRMLTHRPEMRLLAETGGKNATIVTALADRDQAIRNVIHSAFSHGGQKCSATSLLLLQEEVYEDSGFRSTLVDAVTSLKVGSAWDLSTKMGPMISPPSGVLERGLKELETGESWAVLPEPCDSNPCLYTPGIKWDVQPGSYTHMTEFFGPLLAVMKFRTLHEAIDLVNQTGFGLTSGLESLDDREQEYWLKGISAGNLYVNRPTTGAVVLRQPFGGMGKSAYGPGIKAGGPNYVAQLVSFRSTADSEASVSQAGKSFTKCSLADESLQQLAEALSLIEPDSNEESSDITRSDIHQLLEALNSYDMNAQAEFCKQHDHFRLIGQDNLRRYLPVPSLCIRIHEEDSWVDVFARAAAARAVGCRAIVSAAPGVATEKIELLHDLTEPWAADIEFVEQSDEELIDSLSRLEIGRLRYAAPDRVPIEVRVAAIDQLVHVADSRVLAEGRIELLWYLEEQSVCIDYHRYGNLGARIDEPRSDTE